MQKSKSQLEIFCTECNSPKQLRYCNICKRETVNLFKKNLLAIAQAKPWTKQYMKSAERVENKPKREVKQWTSRKDESVITRYDRLRENGKPTKVIHSLWRKFGSIFKKVHEDEK